MHYSPNTSPARPKSKGRPQSKCKDAQALVVREQSNSVDKMEESNDD